jgi:hypothetical protein
MVKVKRVTAPPLELRDSSSIIRVGGIRKVLEIVVEEGDTWDSVVEQCNVSPGSLYRSNERILGEEYPPTLTPGAKLYHSESGGSGGGVRLSS